MDAGVHEDEGLWDELSNQQSREIEQHRARTQPSSNIDTVQRIARRAADEVGRMGNSVYQSATAAFHESSRTRRSVYQGFRRQPLDQLSYLDDFGIPKDDPLLASEFPEPGTENDAVGEETDRTPESPAPESDAGKTEFVFLNNFRQRTTDDGWSAAPNLDVYFTNLYAYFYHRGLVPVLGKGIVELFTLFFTLFLSVFLFAYVDFAKLVTCIDEASCEADFSAYCIKAPFTRLTAWNCVVLLYCLIFIAYGGFAIWSFANNSRDAWKAKWIFEERLGISARKLEGGAVDWDRDVVQKLVKLQTSGEYRIAIHGQDLDALVIAHRIMRKENFLIALFNKNLLDLSVPYFGHNFYCPSLEWSVYFSILNFMFNHKYNIRPAFYLDPVALRRRLILCGVAHAIFMPFLVFFMTLHFGLQNAYDWKSTKQYLGPREWSLTAKWTFREFNELPHHFERRLAPSYEAAQAYLQLFGQNEVMVVVGRILAFIGGSVGAVLFVFAAINDAILLHVKIADWNLLWFAGVAGILFSAGKSMLPSGEARPRFTRNMHEEMDSALASVAQHTHHYPDIFRGRGWDSPAHKSLSAMFKFKAQLFAHEILSLILAPYILCVSLPPCAQRICEFVLAIKSEVAGAGEVCGYSNFDFDSFGDETWEGRTIGNASANEPVSGSLSSSVLQLGVDQARQQYPKPKARHGKMEKSFFSFKASHPSWKCSESGQHLVDRVDRYRREETAALRREQQMHVEAAAREIETLARLENQNNASWDPLGGVNEAYMKPADAGAGTSSQSTDGQSDSRPVALDSRRFAGPNSLASIKSHHLSLMMASHRGGANNALHSSANLSASIDLSAEFRRLLNTSTLDHDIFEEDASHRTALQYTWLERYHKHISSQGATRELRNDEV